MRKRVIVLVTILLLIVPAIVFGHSGRTDNDGGHNDYNNASGLGEYHYHHEEEAHPHNTDGSCPLAVQQEAPYEVPDSYEAPELEDYSEEEPYSSVYANDYENLIVWGIIIITVVAIVVYVFKRK